MQYEYLDDAATADIAFIARAGRLEELFTAAAEATVNVMVEDLDSIRPAERREIALEAEALDMLLFALLQELIYLKDAEGLLLRVSGVTLDLEAGRQRLRAVALGEPLDLSRHRTRVDVKAVTLHRFSVERLAAEGGWQAYVILDI